MHTTRIDNWSFDPDYRSRSIAIFSASISSGFIVVKERLFFYSGPSEHEDIESLIYFFFLFWNKNGFLSCMIQRNQKSPAGREWTRLATHLIPGLPFFFRVIPLGRSRRRRRPECLHSVCVCVYKQERVSLFSAIFFWLLSISDRIFIVDVECRRRAIGRPLDPVTRPGIVSATTVAGGSVSVSPRPHRFNIYRPPPVTLTDVLWDGPGVPDTIVSIPLG